MNTENSIIVTNFIEEIWNQNQFDKMNNYLSDDFIDHSLLPSLPPNKQGMKLWIGATGKSFEHKTIIDDMVCEQNKVMIKISMQMKHIGVWRDIEPTHLDISTVGFRYFQLANGKINAHWALIDGNAIEQQLKDSSAGCKIHK
jgi:predicted SnoaL-like aldol condensation-catalyzing enzyme